MKAPAASIYGHGSWEPLAVLVTCSCGAFWSIRVGSGDRVKTKCPKCGKVYRVKADMVLSADIWELTEATEAAEGKETE